MFWNLAQQLPSRMPPKGHMPTHGNHIQSHTQRHRHTTWYVKFTYGLHQHSIRLVSAKMFETALLQSLTPPVTPAFIILGPLGASWEPPGASWDLLGASWGLLGHPCCSFGPPGISWGFVGPPGASWDPLGPPWSYRLGPPTCMLDPLRPLRKSWDLKLRGTWARSLFLRLLFTLCQKLRAGGDREAYSIKSARPKGRQGV